MQWQWTENINVPSSNGRSVMRSWQNHRTNRVPPAAIDREREGAIRAPGRGPCDAPRVRMLPLVLASLAACTPAAGPKPAPAEDVSASAAAPLDGSANSVAEPPTAEPAAERSPSGDRCDPLPKVGDPCGRRDSYCVESWGERGGWSTALWCRDGRWEREEERNLPADEP